MRSGPSSRILTLLGAGLILTLLVAFFFLGSVHPLPQALVHVLVGAGAFLAMGLSHRRLAQAGIVLRYGQASLVLLGGLALGLLWLPAPLAQLLAPGRVLARPGFDWVSLSFNPSDVVGEMATFTLVLGFGALVATWGAGSHQRPRVEEALVALAGLLATCMLVHAGVGAESVLGLLKPRTLEGRFFAPLVNPNHGASVMLVGGLVALGGALDVLRPLWYRLCALGVAALSAAVIVWSGSRGAALAGLAGLLVLAAWRGRRLAVPVTLLLGVLSLGLQLWAVLSGWNRDAFIGRLVLWKNTLALLADHWLAGVGGGNFGDAIRAYRSDMVWGAPVFAHDDLLEWVAETGLMGALALLVALALLRPGPIREKPRMAGLVAGCFALGVHSFVEFPLQVPAVAMVLAGGVALGLSVHCGHLTASGPTVRRFLLAIGLLQVPAALWQTRAALVARAAQDLRQYPVDPARGEAAAARLTALGARGPERLLALAWRAEKEGQTSEAVDQALAVAARWPDRPDALRPAALVLARAHEYDRASQVLRRAAERDPSDKRPWVLLARVANASGDPLGAADLWVQAFRRGETQLEEAWETLPVALFWYEAFEGHSAVLCASLSQFLLARGEGEVALLASEEAARLDPVAFGRHLPRAMILLSLGRAQDALDWLQPILETSPDDPDVLDVLARAQAALGRHDQATETWIRGARSRPEQRVMALRSAEKDGGLDKALNLARRFEIEGGIDPLTGIEIAHLRQRGGNPQACIQAIERWSAVPGASRSLAETRLESCRKDLNR